MDFKRELAATLAQAINADSDAGAEVDDILSAIEIPPDSQMGDYAFPCFRLAKTMRKAPQIIARELCETMELPAFIEKVDVASAYLNFTLNRKEFVREALRRLQARGADYGKSDIGGGRNVVIDYSSPNIAKNFHIGHLRTTVIGRALYNIMNFVGYKSVGINHLGDWGTQFGKLITAFVKWGSKEDVECDGIQELNRLYVLFHEEAESDSGLEDEARAWFLNMQNGDEEALSVWKWFVDVSMAEFDRIYEMLGVKFDHFTGESFYNDKMDVVVNELRAKNLLVQSEGATIVDLSSHNMPPCLILRSDGGTLYHTRDIAAALYRKRTFDFAKALYVTAMDQNLHFAQLFRVIEEMGYEWAADMTHVPYGLVSLESGKLSTRKGNVILMEELLGEAVSRTLSIIEERNPSLSDKESIARDVGIGAVIFNDLYNSRIKDVVFSWERVLSFEGESGPYVQYTHARACSVLEKAGVDDNSDLISGIDYSLLSDQASFDIVKLVYIFGDKVQESAAKLEPYVIARYLVDMAQAFNKFYHDNQILTDDAELRAARLALVYAVRVVLKSGLALLGINAPVKM
ncbi:MAG: arginine--tRNA ligase [Defluviitaleaceae bacterium]|nr:arginine--tRNA ligase [Defluviitaleaceae bacterium]